MSRLLETVLIAVVLVLLSASMYQYLARYVIYYRVYDGDVSIFLGGMRIIHVPRSRITSVRQVNFADILKPSLKILRLGNRLFGNYVIVEKKGGILYSRIIITPDNPVDFIQSILSKIPSNSHDKMIEE